jgi:hypothetical protein
MMKIKSLPIWQFVPYAMTYISECCTAMAQRLRLLRQQVEINFDEHIKNYLEKNQIRGFILRHQRNHWLNYHFYMLDYCKKLQWVN